MMTGICPAVPTCSSCSCLRGASTSPVSKNCGIPCFLLYEEFPGKIIRIRHPKIGDSFKTIQVRVLRVVYRLRELLLQTETERGNIIDFSIPIDGLGVFKWKNRTWLFSVREKSYLFFTN
jgi:hypothetical protein